MAAKISIQEYLENNELLEMNYIPYEQRVEICQVILEQCTSIFDDYNTIDSVLLDRVKTEIFIDNITNLDFSIKDENGLNGYDQLCFNNELDNLIYECGYLYEQFEDILDLMINDYYNNIACTRGYLNILKKNLTKWVGDITEDITKKINNIDSKKIVDSITDILGKYQNKFSKK